MQYNVIKVGQKIKKMRETSGLTQQQIADYLGTDLDLISGFEAGTKTISSNALAQLSVLFCCPISSLLHDDTPKPIYHVHFNTNEITRKDLISLSEIHQIAMNQQEMEQLTETAK